MSPKAASTQMSWFSTPGRLSPVPGLCTRPRTLTDSAVLSRPSARKRTPVSPRASSTYSTCPLAPRIGTGSLRQRASTPSMWATTWTVERGLCSVRAIRQRPDMDPPSGEKASQTHSAPRRPSKPRPSPGPPVAPSKRTSICSRPCSPGWPRRPESRTPSIETSAPRSPGAVASRPASPTSPTTVPRSRRGSTVATTRPRMPSTGTGKPERSPVLRLSQPW